MAALSSKHKRLIVTRLATFVSPTEIQRELQGLGVTVSLSQLAYYNPESAGTELATEWRTLFEETRRRYVDEAADIAVGKQAFRLRQLQDLYFIAKERKNLPLAAQLLEQAAKDEGGAYTNRRIVAGAIAALNPHLDHIARVIGTTPAIAAAFFASLSPGELQEAMAMFDKSEGQRLADTMPPPEPQSLVGSVDSTERVA